MSDYRYVATNITGLHAEPTFASELLTQALNGVRLEILEENKQWRRVRQDDGYTGWTYAPYLTAEVPMPPTHVIDAPSIALIDKPHGLLGRLLAGTFVHVNFDGGRPRIHPAGAMILSGFVATPSLRDLPALPLSLENARHQMIADARKFTGTPYLWGGASALGIDCSGLCQLVHRLAGYEIPRDARLQFPVAVPVVEPLSPGDLPFFHADNDPNRITHVGLCTGGWRMIHASRARNGVYEEDVHESQNLISTFAGARTLLAGGTTRSGETH